MKIWSINCFETVLTSRMLEWRKEGFHNFRAILLQLVWTIMISWSNLGKITKNKFLLIPLSYATPPTHYRTRSHNSRQIIFFGQKWLRNKLLRFLDRLDRSNLTYAAIKGNLEMSAWDPGYILDISCSMFWRQISRNWRNSVASFRAQWQESYHHVWRPGMCHFSKVLVFKVEIQRCGREVTSCLSPRWGSWREPTTQRSKPIFAGGLHFNFLIVLNSRHKLWLTTCTLAKALDFDHFHS